MSLARVGELLVLADTTTPDTAMGDIVCDPTTVQKSMVCSMLAGAQRELLQHYRGERSCRLTVLLNKAKFKQEMRRLLVGSEHEARL